MLLVIYAPGRPVSRYIPNRGPIPSPLPRKSWQSWGVPRHAAQYEPAARGANGQAEPPAWPCAVLEPGYSRVSSCSESPSDVPPRRRRAAAHCSRAPSLTSIAESRGWLCCTRAAPTPSSCQRSSQSCLRVGGAKIAAEQSRRSGHGGVKGGVKGESALQGTRLWRGRGCRGHVALEGTWLWRDRGRGKVREGK